MTAAHHGSPAPPSDSSLPAQATRTRVVFVDVARALAVLFMIFGHSLNVLLDPSYQQSVTFAVLLFLRGLTSCTFLFLSGFAFTIASSHYWESHLHVSWRVLTRVRRFAFFVALGYLMRFPARRLAHLQYVGAEGWQTFLAVDILQCIGVTLIGLQLLIILARTQRRFALSAALLAAVVVLVTPMAWAVDWRLWLPVGVAAYLSPATGSLFPLLPWSAFPLLGAALGYVYVSAWLDDPLKFSRRVLLPGGVTLALGGLILSRLPLSPLGPTDFWFTSPNLFLIRAGLVLIVLDVVSFLTRWAHHLPRVVASLANESLLVYFIHLMVLYGSAWTPGLRHLLPVPLSPGAAAVWIAVMLVSMSLIGWAWNWTKRRHRWAAIAMRLTVLGLFIYQVG